jgi:hypothetical protein
MLLPRIDRLELVFAANQPPRLRISGDRFIFAAQVNGSPLGTQVTDLRVNFQFGIESVNNPPIQATPLAGGTGQLLEVEIPDAVAVGLARISVERPHVRPGGNAANAADIVRVESNSFFLEPGPSYAFVPLGGTGQVAVIDARETIPPAAGAAGQPTANANFNQIVARMGLRNAGLVTSAARRDPRRDPCLRPLFAVAPPWQFSMR